jgi:hypothetical protein
MYSNIVEMYYRRAFLDNLYHGCKETLCWCWHLPPTVCYMRGLIACHYCPLHWYKQTANCVLSKDVAWIFHTTSARPKLSCYFRAVEWLDSGGYPVKYISSNFRLLSTAHCLHCQRFDCISPIVTSWSNRRRKWITLVINYRTEFCVGHSLEANKYLKPFPFSVCCYILTLSSIFFDVFHLCAHHKRTLSMILLTNNELQRFEQRYIKFVFQLVQIVWNMQQWLLSFSMSVTYRNCSGQFVLHLSIVSLSIVCIYYMICYSERNEIVW